MITTQFKFFVGEATSLPRAADCRPYKINKGDLYMKATGIVRRIDECVIIGQKCKIPHKHRGFADFRGVQFTQTQSYIAKAE